MDLRPYRVREVTESLFYVPNFITDIEADLLCAQVYAAPIPKWTLLRNRRLQNWGGAVTEKGLLKETLPLWLLSLTSRLSELQIFDGREADHVLINEYLSGQGIMPHEDGPFYYPVIANITLGSHTVLQLYEKGKEEEEGVSPNLIGGILLEPNSLVVIRHDLYKVLHGIDERTHDLIDHTILNRQYTSFASTTSPAPPITLERGTRVSLTIRSAMKSRRMPDIRLSKSTKPS